MNRRFTDSAGIVVDYTPVEEVRKGDVTVSGWRPYPVIEGVDVNHVEGEPQYRLSMALPRPDGTVRKHDHKGDWLPAGTEIPILVHDPATDGPKTAARLIVEEMT